MMFFSSKLKFKKQSESLALNLNDKCIRKRKQELISLTQKHQQVDDSLKKKKIEFQNDKNKLMAEHQFLIAEEKRHKLKIIKLEVRKDQLTAKKNPSIAHQKGQVLKKYLKSMIYTIGDRYFIIKSLGSCSTYEFIKTRILNLEHKLYFKQKMKEVVFMKKFDFQDEKIMLIIKQKQDTIPRPFTQNQLSSNKIKTVKSILNPSKFNPASDDQLTIKRSYEVKIFALTGQKFQFTKNYEEKQLNSFIDKLSNQKRSQMFNSIKTLSGPNQNRKPRLSLQFNSVFKKSLAGFFFQRSSLTTNELNNKLVNIQEWLIQSKNGQNSNIDSSSHSKVSRQESICESQQGRQEINLSRISRGSSASQITQLTKNKDKIVSRKHQGKQSNQSYSKNQISENTSKNLFVAFQPQTRNQLIKINPMIKAVQTSNFSSNNEQSQISFNNTSKPSTDLAFNGFLRPFICGEKILFPDFNPLLNIVILKKKKTFDFLPEYLQKKDNFNKINLCIKKYQLKIKLQKQVRKSLLYKIITIDNFFQTQNKAMEPFSVEVLFSVKYAKNDVYVPKIDEIKQCIRLGNQLPANSYGKGRYEEGFEFNGNDIKGFNLEDIVISCQNIRCEHKDKTFLIHQILKKESINEMQNRMLHIINGMSSQNTRIKGRSANVDFKRKKSELKVSELDNSKQQKNKKRKKKAVKTVVQNEDLKEEQERKELFFREEIQSLFESFIQSNLLSITDYRFMKKINFQENIDKVIMIQKNMKCCYYRKKYKQMIKNPCIFKFESGTKILITAIHDTKSQNIKIFTECLLLILNQKYKSYPIMYPEKYWLTISSALTNLTRMSESIIEVKDDLEKYLQKKVRIYEQEQIRLETLKPQLYLNRLRRFFINIMLRVKAKRNIIYLKKLYQSSEVYILMIRKSSILKNVCQANLYHLEYFIEKEQNKENQIQTQNEVADLINEKTLKSIKNLNEKQVNKKHKSRYQTINLLVDYFSKIPKDKIADEFYFDSQHFLLKPPKGASVYYIERILMIDINSQQIAKEVAMIEWQQPSKMKKTYEKNEFLNLGAVDRSSLISAALRSSQIKQSTEFNQDKQFRVRRQNNSIKILNQLQEQNKQKSSRKGSQHMERKSFRISQLANTKHLEGKSRRGRENSKLLLAKQQRPSIMNEQSSNKLSSANRLSRSSLYDIFNSYNNNNKKSQYQIIGNGHGKLLYYSLAKVQQVFYELHIYIVQRKFIVTKFTDCFYQPFDPQKEAIEGNNNKKRVVQNKTLANKVSYNCEEETVVSQEMNYLKKNAFTDEIFLVHKENITKKQLLESNWAFIYGKIARWIKNNEHLLVLVEENPNNF